MSLPVSEMSSAAAADFYGTTGTDVSGVGENERPAPKILGTLIQLLDDTPEVITAAWT